MDELVEIPLDADAREAFPEFELNDQPGDKNQIHEEQREARSVAGQEMQEAASQHDLKPRQEDGKPSLLEPNEASPKNPETVSPAQESSENILSEFASSAKEGLSDTANLPVSEGNDQQTDLKPDVQETREELPVTQVPQADEDASVPPILVRETSYTDFVDYVQSGMSEEEERAASSEVRTELVAFAQEQKLAVQQTAAEQQSLLEAESVARIEAIQGIVTEKSEQIRATFAASLAAIESLAASEKQTLQADFESKKAQLEADTAAQLESIEQEIESRRMDFEGYADNQKQVPQQFAVEEANRADAELDQAVAESRRIGNAEASRYSGSDDNKPEQREAAQKVARDSASDIAQKKAPIRQSLMEEAANFEGDYDTFILEVVQQLDEVKTSLKPVVEQKANDALIKLEELKAKSIEKIDDQLQKDKDHLSAAEAAAIAKVNKGGNDSMEMVSSSKEEGCRELHTLESTLLREIDASQSKYTRIMDSQSVPRLEGMQELADQGKEELTQISSSGKTEMRTNVTQRLSSFEQLGTAFGEQATDIVEDAQKTGEDIQEAFSEAVGVISEAFKQESEELLTKTTEDQTQLVSDTLTGLDGFIQQRKDKLAEVNEEFKETLRTKTDESIDRAKLPLTDPLTDRVAEAAQRADQSWWEGALDALASLVLVLIIIIAIAAILIALGVSGTALLVIGLVALAAFGIYAAYERYQDGYSLGQSILWGLGDVIGYTGIYEAITGEMVVPPGHDPVLLSEYERGRRGTEGTVNLLLLIAPIKGRIPGLRRIPGLGSMFRGIKGMIPAALMREGALLPRIFEAVAGGVNRVRGVIADGMKALEEQGARSRRFYRRVWDRLVGNEPVPEGSGSVPLPEAEPSQSEIPSREEGPRPDEPVPEEQPVQNPEEEPLVAGREPVPHPDINAEVQMGEFNYSQKTISPETSDGTPLDEVVNAMREHGWDVTVDPPTMVEYGNGKIVTLDHRRLVAARMAEITRIPIRLIEGATAIPEELAVARNFVIGRLPRWRLTQIAEFLGKDPATIVRGYIARTWEEAAVIRCSRQGNDFPLDGSPNPPTSN